jgi:predicted phosphodiesterase
MRVLAISDLHVDYEENARWLESLPPREYRHDVLILAGDLSDSLTRLEWALSALARRFARVVYTPGNHDLWVRRDPAIDSSLVKLDRIRAAAERCGVWTGPCHIGTLSIVPLYGWYDYSFGEPDSELRQSWMDYGACRWPPDFDEAAITAHFLGLNGPALATQNDTIISCSHFLPRIDVMPSYIPRSKRYFYPVLGTSRLDEQIRGLGSAIHVYGHSHVNQHITIEGVTYINNAFGYPSESNIAAKRLISIHEID